MRNSPVSKVTISLFEHALRLHRRTPDAPFHRDGEPFPDHDRSRRRARVPWPGNDLDGVDVARILDAHFADPDAEPRDLVGRLDGVHVSNRPNEHITAAAVRAGDRARTTGRWLVRHGTERYDVIVGLALLGAVGTAADIPRIQTIGLLSRAFGPLAVAALARLPGSPETLFWLAERVTRWGRVEAVYTLCDLVDEHPDVRSWLLRSAADGDHLNGYFAGLVAKVAGLHDAMTRQVPDTDVVDHAGRLLHVMCHCAGMGTTLALYPHASAVMTAHVRRLAQLGPSAERFFIAGMLARNLSSEEQRDSVGPAEQWTALRDAYLALLDRDDWCETARHGLAAGDRNLVWLAEIGAELGLRGLGISTP